MELNTKSEFLNTKQIIISKPSNPKHYDLEDRTLNFAKDVNQFVISLQKNVVNLENGKQLVRSSGSIWANYIEANEALSKKDFILRIKISKKEAKETIFWLKLLITDNDPMRQRMIKEANELMKIFGAIIEKSK